MKKAYYAELCVEHWGPIGGPIIGAQHAIHRTADYWDGAVGCPTTGVEHSIVANAVRVVRYLLDSVGVLHAVTKSFPNDVIL